MGRSATRFCVGYMRNLQSPVGQRISPSRLTQRTSVDALTLEAFLGNLAELLVHLQRRSLDSLLRKWRSRQSLLDRAAPYLRASITQPFDLMVMAKAIGASPRSLQRHFASAYGMTPQKWARCLALHEARRRLRRQPSAPSGDRPRLRVHAHGALRRILQALFASPPRRWLVELGRAAVSGGLSARFRTPVA
jgi:hypothetical protein